MLIVVGSEGGFPQEFTMGGALGEHDPGERQGRAEIESQSPHGVVAVPAQRGLYEWNAQFKITQHQHRPEIVSGNASFSSLNWSGVIGRLFLFLRIFSWKIILSISHFLR
jgi:hypothetical protein